VATGTNPIVFAVGTSFNKHPGSLTGVATLLTSLEPKQLELLHELRPEFSRVAFLVNTSNQDSRIDAPEIQAAADALGANLEVLTASQY
jgi:ABC-type uncharacterized transport system substrate-binding protein